MSVDKAIINFEALFFEEWGKFTKWNFAIVNSKVVICNVVDGASKSTENFEEEEEKYSFVTVVEHSTHNFTAPWMQFW